MSHSNVHRALNVLSALLEEGGWQSRIATASNADDILNAFDAMRANLREEAQRTYLENKQKLFNDLRTVNTSFGLVIQSMAALGADTKLMQKLQGTITKITADLSFTGEGDADNDGIRDSAVIRGTNGEPTLDLDVDGALERADELFQGLNQKPTAMPAEQAAEQALDANQGGFADDVDTDDTATALPGTGGMADDFEDNKNLNQAVDEAAQKQAEAPAEGEQGAGGEGGDDFADGGSPFDGTSNDDTGLGGDTGGAPVAEEQGAPSDDQLDNLFDQEFPPAAKSPAAPQQTAQSSVEIVSFDGSTSIKRVPVLVATAADSSIAFYRAVDSYMDGDSEAVASVLTRVAKERGEQTAVKALSRLVSEGNVVEVMRV
jgi:hypothetical protein